MTTTTQQFVCHICGQGFANESEFNEHLHTHEKYNMEESYSPGSRTMSINITSMILKGGSDGT